MMQSKLPEVQTTIFTVMSQMAQEFGAINLSQGFPDFEVSKTLIDGIYREMLAGKNQYAPMPGLPILQDRIAEKISSIYGIEINGAEMITIAGGATEANYSAITALVHPGDEVIIFEPAYDSYAPVVKLNQGVTIPIKLNFPDFSIPWDEVWDSINSRTKLIVINTPHNPTGSILKRSDLRELVKICEKHDVFILSDEVYEHIIFDNEHHESLLKYPELMERGIAVFSFGKTFHATGWKVGYAVANPMLTKEIRQVHQFLNFSVNTPIQWALADYLKDSMNYLEVSPFYQKKRDLFLSLTKDSRFEPIPSRGTYFQLMTYNDISDRGDVDMAEYLTKQKGIASIPISVFYHDQHDDHVLRFCFAKTDETLERAAEILCKI